MRKPIISSFRYKRYIDVYVRNVSLSTGELLSILNIFPDQKVMVLIESDEDYIQTILTTGKIVGIEKIALRLQASRIIAVCNKTELGFLLNRTNIDNFEGLFIASMHNDIIADDLTYSLECTASSMVKDGISDISISIDFPENQIVLSLLKEKYGKMSINDNLRNILGD